MHLFSHFGINKRKKTYGKTAGIIRRDITYQDGEQLMELTEAKRITEALLFGSSNPLSLDQIKEIVGEIRPSQIKVLIEELNAEYDQTGKSLR